MNDTELDNLLNTWTTPDAPPSLRGRARAGYATLSRRRAQRNAAAASSANREDAAASCALPRTAAERRSIVDAARNVRRKVRSHNLAHQPCAPPL